jgi:glycerol dehydrogenase
MKKYNLAIAPKKYIQGENVLYSEEKIMSDFGRRTFLIGEEFILKKFRHQLNSILRRKSIFSEPFNRECSKKEIERLLGVWEKRKAEFVVGIGGGKALDTAKAVGYYARLPVVTIPTSAATCAAWTALSAIYTEDGKARGYLILDRCPEVLIVDTRIMANAPVRYLVAGMADGLAKYYETMAYTRGKASGLTVGMAINSAQSIYNAVFEVGLTAARDNMNKKLTPVFTRIIESNIMLAGLVGGIGGEGCRAAAIHALNNGFTQFPQTHNYLHGEVVAFCSLVQLFMEGKMKELEKLNSIYEKLRLPRKLKDIGLESVPLRQRARARRANKLKSLLEKVVKYACSPQETMRNFPKKVSEKMVYDAILEVDRLGQG